MREWARRRASGSCCDVELSQPSQFALLQDLREVNQDHEAPVQLAYSRHVLDFVFFKDFRGSFDFVLRQTDDFGSRIDDETHQLLVDLCNEDAILASGFNPCFAEALSQIDYGYDLSPKVDHAFDVIGDIGHGSNFGDSHDFMHEPDRHAERFLPDTEPNELEVFSHPNPFSCIVRTPPRRTASPTWPTLVNARRVPRGAILLASRPAISTSVCAAVAMPVHGLEDKAIHGVEQCARHLGHLVGRGSQFSRSRSGTLDQLTHFLHGADNGLSARSLFFN